MDQFLFYLSSHFSWDYETLFTFFNIKLLLTLLHGLYCRLRQLPLRRTRKKLSIYSFQNTIVSHAPNLIIDLTYSANKSNSIHTLFIFAYERAHKTGSKFNFTIKLVCIRHMSFATAHLLLADCSVGRLGLLFHIHSFQWHVCSRYANTFHLKPLYCTIQLLTVAIILS